MTAAHRSDPDGGRRVWLIALATLLSKALLLFVLLPYVQSGSPQDYAAGSFPDNYDQIAWNLVQGNGYRVFADTSLTMLRTPGFVLVLAAVFAVFGKSLVAVQGMHLVFSALTAAIIYRLARSLGLTTATGLIAAVLFFFYPGVVIAESRGGLESMLMLCLAASVWLAVQAQRNVAWRTFALLGLVNGITLLVKSSAAPVLPVLFAYWLWQAPDRETRRKLLSRMVVSALLSALVLAPWVARNYAISGKIVPTMTVSGLALFQGAYLVSHLESPKEHFEILNDAADEQLSIAREMGLHTREAFFPQFYTIDDEILYYGELGRRAVTQYQADPPLLLRGLTHNAWAFWIGGRTAKATLLNSVLTIPVLLLAIGGFVIGWRRTWHVLPLGLTILAYMLPHLPILAMARYYIPLMPFVVLLAAVPLAEMNSYFRNRRFRF